MENALLAAHVPEKVTLYLDFVKLFVETLETAKSRKDIKNLSSKMLRIGLGMMVLAPDPVTKAYTYWLALSMEKGDPEPTLDALGDLIMEMRKDLVGETTCSRDDAVGIFLRDQV